LLRLLHYYLLLSACSAASLLALFAWATSKFLGSAEIAVRSLNIFTEDFFGAWTPRSFKEPGRGLQAHQLARAVRHHRLDHPAGSFLFGQPDQGMNTIFRVKATRSFFYNRLMENVIMLIMAVILLFSFSITAAWATVHKAVQTSTLVSEYINPRFLRVRRQLPGPGI